MLYLDHQKGLKHGHRAYTFELGFQLNFLAQFIDVSLPENFSPDGDGLGIYTHCLYCGGDGTYEGIKIEVKAESKEI